MLERGSERLAHGDFTGLAALRLYHPNYPMLEVDILPGEGEEFATAQPTMQCRDQHRSQRLIRHIKQPRHFLMTQIA
jgi:hypothetical protein